MALTLTQTYGCTPLLTLQHLGKDTGAILLAKQESRNPMGSVKCRIAVAMIEAGIRDGLINDDTLIVEPTSGNTGIALAFVCAASKYRLILTMPDTMSVERRALFRHLGAELVLTPGAEGMKGAIAKAREIVAHDPQGLYARPVWQPGQPGDPSPDHG